MSATGLPVFDETLQKTNIWLKEIMSAMAWGEERHRAYLGLRVTLHALRDHLGVDEAAHLGAQLPMLVRGVYFEGWRPAGKPVKERHKEEFVGQIAAAFHATPEVDPEKVVRSVFQVLARHITEGEASDVRNALPKGIREMWPA